MTGQDARAPRTAYELTAATAEHDDAAAWAILRGLGQEDTWRVVVALGAQARQAAAVASAEHAPEIRFEQHLEALGELRGSPAREAALAALGGDPVAPPRPMPPAAALAAAARCLAGITARTLAGAGLQFPAIAVLCRRAAG